MNYNGADYNAFGYDPEGRIAAVAAYFYGPAWQPVHSQPVHSHGIPWPTGCIIGPPRYGPPVLWQIPSLPNKFIACLPPLLHWMARCISARPKHVQHHKLCSPFSYLAKLTHANNKPQGSIWALHHGRTPCWRSQGWRCALARVTSSLTWLTRCSSILGVSVLRVRVTEMRVLHHD